MPRNPQTRVDAALPQEPAAPRDNASHPRANGFESRPLLSRGQILTSWGLTVFVAGYSAFADVMESIFTLNPLRSEYELEEVVSEKAWLSYAVALAGIYGLATLFCEGKGVYDSITAYFQNQNERKGPSNEEELQEVIEVEPRELEQPPLPAQTCSKKLGAGALWFFPRALAVISSAVGSSETTMGLVKENASLPKVIAVSVLSFSGSVAFYGPITVDAVNELVYGAKPFPPMENSHSRLLSQIVGYPVAFFSAIQDTLECGASLFQNFGVTGLAQRWGLVGISSLAGISGLCLDGKMGVEILDHFFVHLEKNYAWLPKTLLLKQCPTQGQLIQLAYETNTTALAAYAASYIAFADKQLVISLSELILNILHLNVPGLPLILGWCVALRDFVIQTKTLHMLEDLLLNAGYRSGKYLWQRCAAEASASQLEELELHSLDASEGEEDDDDEETGLLSRKPVRQPPQSCFSRFFQGFQKAPASSYEVEPQSALSCTIL